MRTAHSIQPAAPGLDEHRLRAAFGRFATGVTFVTADVQGSPLGLIVSSFAAVSLEPPLVSICVGRASMTWQRMRRAGRVTIHVLGARHGGFARRAAPAGADRFAEPGILRHAIAAMECDLEAEHAAGDHWIVVARVRGMRLRADAEPLVYFGGRFGGFRPH